MDTRQDLRPPLSPTPAILEGIANLHDAFMNANLMRVLMEREPMIASPEKFMVSNRGRLERAWATYLYVLIEAWRTKANTRVRQYIGTKASLEKLKHKLKDAEKSGVIRALREARHYMCHRDKRLYWDEGRMGPIGNLTAMEELNNAFGAVLLDAMRQ